MAENIEPKTVDWGALYQQERQREPVRQLCPGIDRHFQWEASNDCCKVPIDWLRHYAPAFHFIDTELWEARTTEEMPVASGVYFLFKDDACIYVGQTNHLANRMEQHKRNEVHWTSHAYFEVPKFFARDVEAYYIHRLKPVLNGDYPKITTYSRIIEELGLDSVKLAAD